MNKCNKCDERGYIVDTPHPSYSGHSCECGWALAQTKARFDDMFADSNDLLEKLMAYAHQRRRQKGAMK